MRPKESEKREWAGLLEGRKSLSVAPIKQARLRSELDRRSLPRRSRIRLPDLIQLASAPPPERRIGIEHLFVEPPRPHVPVGVANVEFVAVAGTQRVLTNEHAGGS